MLEEWETDLSAFQSFGETSADRGVWRHRAFAVRKRGWTMGIRRPASNKISSIGFGGGHPASTAQIRILEQWAGLK